MKNYRLLTKKYSLSYARHLDFVPLAFISGGSLVKIRTGFLALFFAFSLSSCGGDDPIKDRPNSIDYSPLLTPTPAPSTPTASSAATAELNGTESIGNDFAELCRKLYQALEDERSASPAGAASGSTHTTTPVARENTDNVQARNAQLVQEINNFRAYGMVPAEVAQFGTLSVLQHDHELQKAAQIQLEDLSKRNYFSHTSPEGCTLLHRVQFATNFGNGRIAENLARGQASAAAVRLGWQNSRGHRLNMLAPQHRRIGVASKRNSQGALIWVAVFGSKETDLVPTPKPTAARPTADLRHVQCDPPFQMVWAGPSANQFAYCKDSKQASGPITKEMRRLCNEWGGGAATCASNTWSENMYLSARGQLYCPRGSRLAADQKTCLE